MTQQSQISIELFPEDYFWITWQAPTPLVRPSVQPFNLKDALARLKKTRILNYDVRSVWSRAHIAPALSAEEAHFWFYAMTGIPESASYPCDFNQANAIWKQLLAIMPRMDMYAPLTLEEVRKAIIQAYSHVTPEWILPLYYLLPLESFTKLLIEADGLPARALEDEQYIVPWFKLSGEVLRNEIFYKLLTGFRLFILPYLTPAERTHLRELMLPLPAGTPAIEQGYYRLAAILGLYDAVHTLLQDPSALQQYQAPQEIIFGLENSALIIDAIRHRNIGPQTPEQIRGWLALTGTRALDVVTRGILSVCEITPEENNNHLTWNAPVSKKLSEQIEPHLQALAQVHAPEVAFPMLQFYVQGPHSTVTQRWLLSHPEFSIAGLIPWIDKTRKLNSAILDWLGIFYRQGYEETIRTHLKALAPPAAGKIMEAILKNVDEVIPLWDTAALPTWWTEHLPNAQTITDHKITWIDPLLLPPLVIEGRRLPPEQIETLLVILKLTPLTQERPPLLLELKQRSRRESLSHFLWELFELWLKNGSIPAEKWAMKALGLLGDDTIALKLTPLIRRWPGENQHHRSVMGLECLEAIGTDLALMQINHIAQKAPFKGIKARAQQALEAIARKRNLTCDQLEDRLVPDCELNDHGDRTFDFGPRQFKFKFNAELKPLIQDADGRLKTDLPKPNSKDDPEKSARAVADWKILKKQIRDTAVLQTIRLEQAMIAERRWQSGEFQLLFVRHPFMINLTRMLVWGAYDRENNLTATFRVTEDQTLADADDNLLTLSDRLTIGIVHPFYLPEQQKNNWNERFHDYEILQPFPQLNREIYTATAEELPDTKFTRWNDIKIPAAALISTLEKRGWIRDPSADGGAFYNHARLFPAADITAVIEYTGVYMGEMAKGEDQKIEQCFFLKGQHTQIAYLNHCHLKALPLIDIPPLLISEVLRDLTFIATQKIMP